VTLRAQWTPWQSAAKKLTSILLIFAVLVLDLLCGEAH